MVSRLIYRRRRHSHVPAGLQPTAPTPLPDILTQLLSCQERCGLQEGVACSCRSSCVAYDNCCPDFASACPRQYQDSIIKFGQFFNTVKPSSVCRRSISGYHAVNSCPVGTAANTLETDFHTETYKGGLLKAMANIPYSDLSTGLVYVNKSIFQCNTRASESAKGIPWRLTIPVPDVSNLNQSLSENDVLSGVLGKLGTSVFCPMYLPPLELLSNTHDRVNISFGSVTLRTRNLKSLYTSRRFIARSNRLMCSGANIIRYRRVVCLQEFIMRHVRSTPQFVNAIYLEQRGRQCV